MFPKAFFIFLNRLLDVIDGGRDKSQPILADTDNRSITPEGETTINARQEQSKCA
jgi:hypothetical protein